MKTFLSSVLKYSLFSLFVSGTLTCISCETNKMEQKQDSEIKEQSSEPRTFYISSSSGSDSNDGLTQEKAWKTLGKINSVDLQPGDSILLRSGDTWEEATEYNSKFQGTKEAPIVLSSYGEGERPKITSPARDVRALMMIRNADYLTIRNLDFGPFHQYGLRFDISDAKEHHGITIDNVNVHDMNIVGIFFNTRDTPGYRDVKVRGCTGNKVEMLLAVAGCKNVSISNSKAIECIYGGFSLMSVEGGEMSKCTVLNSGTGDYPNGACGVYLGSNSNFIISDCEIAYQQRQGTNPDGEAIDFECSNVNVTVKNCHFHDNAGCAIMFYDNRRNLVNEGCIVENCLFENNGTNWKEPQGFEIHYTKIDNNNNGIIRNNIFLLRSNAQFLTTVDPSVTVTGNRTTTGKDLLIAPPLDEQPQLLNSGFEEPSLRNYERQPAGAVWTFRRGGIAHNGSDFGAPSALEGTQVLFLQGAGANVSQWVAFPAGTYKLSFKLAYRNRGTDPVQGLAIYVDNVLQGREIIPDTTFKEYESIPFTVEAGYRLIELRSTIEGDKTIFVDDIQIVACNE